MTQASPKHPLEEDLSPAEIVALSRVVPVAVEKRAKAAIPANSTADVEFTVGVAGLVNRAADAKAKKGERVQKVDFVSEAFLLAVIAELNPRKGRLAEAVAAVAKRVKQSEDVADLDHPELRAVLLEEAAKTEARLPARPYSTPAKPANVLVPSIETRVFPRKTAAASTTRKRAA